MSSEYAIEVSSLGKCYQIYDKPSDRLKQMLFRGCRQYYKEFWALKDVSFKVKKGETVGIIGRNGSGKSTLLQMICGTLNPTAGEIKVNGRVAALLELGAGFNPEFTGKENVYMAASLYGLTKEEIDQKFEAIVAFADIGDFLFQPVKTYSSGMLVRLAFSVVINVTPDILVVDEALAVGDMHFQAKCMSKLKKMIDDGVTVLFVSHDSGTVKALCQQSLYLKQGNMVGYGKASDLVDMYIAESHMELNKILEKGDAHISGRLNLKSGPMKATVPNKLAVEVDGKVEWPSANRYGNGDVKILDIKLLDTARNIIQELDTDQEFLIQIALRAYKSLPEVVVGYSIRDLKGQMLVGGLTSVSKAPTPEIHQGDIWIVEVKACNSVTAGVYTLSVGIELPVLLNWQHIFLDVIENAITFKSNFGTSSESVFPFMVKTDAEFNFHKV